MRLSFPALVVLASTLTIAACGNLSQIPVFAVSIVNDTNSPVVVRDCDDFCTSSLLVFDLAPGGAVEINRTTGMHKYFSVTTPAGDHIGCVDLYFKTASPGASVPVSGATACPTGTGVPWAVIAAAVVGLLALGALFRRRRAA
jgi:hypothetical protein